MAINVFNHNNHLKMLCDCFNNEKNGNHFTDWSSINKLEIDCENVRMNATSNDPHIKQTPIQYKDVDIVWLEKKNMLLSKKISELSTKSRYNSFWVWFLSILYIHPLWVWKKFKQINSWHVCCLKTTHKE